jgi:hypothetical protein
MTEARFTVVGCFTKAVLENGCDRARAELWAANYTDTGGRFLRDVQHLEPDQLAYSYPEDQYRGIRIQRIA